MKPIAMPVHYAFLIATGLVASLFPSSNAHAQWEAVGEQGNAYGVEMHGSMVLAGLQGDSIYASSDQGDSWNAANTGITEPSNWWLSSVNNALYCGTQFGAAFRSTDNGDSWTNIGLSGARGFTEHNDTLYACQWYSGSVMWSVDQGSTWNPTQTLSGSGGLWPMISHNGYLFVGGQGGGVFRIQYSGEAWANVNTDLGTTIVYAFTVKDDILFAGTANGVWSSANNGDTWTNAGLDGSTIYTLHTVDTLVLAGTSAAGVSITWDDGDNWITFNEGLTAFVVTRITSDNAYFYAGTLGNGGVFRRSLSSIISNVQEVDDSGSAMTIFPLPTRDQVQVQWPGHVPMRYRIRAISGTVLMDARLIGNVIAVDQLAAGAYVLEVFDAQAERRIARLVKD